MRNIVLCCSLLLTACTSREHRYSYNLTNKCVRDYISEHYKTNDEVSFIKIVESKNACKQYYISSIICLSAIKNDPPCYYVTINDKMVLIYTEGCSSKDISDRVSFFISKLRNRLKDDITKQPDRFIDGYKLITVSGFFDPSNVKISECGPKTCTPVLIEKIP